MNQKSSATIADVAREAGVSTATVSRLINGIGPISEETEERVRTAIRELKYSPKRKRRPRSDSMGGAGGSSSNRPLAFLRIGTFESQDRSPVTEQLIEALHRNAHAHGRRLEVHHIPDLQTAQDLRTLLGEAEGVLLRTSNIHEVTKKSVEWLSGVPAVRVLGGNPNGRHWLDHVTPDNEQAGALAAEYLLEKKSSRLIFAASNVLCGVGFERCLAFLKTARAAGVEAHVFAQTVEGGKERLQAELNGLVASCTVTGNRLDMVREIAKFQSEAFGLFIPTDLELATIVPQLQLMGVEFGAHAHAIGCNCETRCLSGLDPMPATMNLHVGNIATRAIRRLIYRIEHPEEPLVRIAVAPEVVHPEDVMSFDLADGMKEESFILPAPAGMDI